MSRSKLQDLRLPPWLLLPLIAATSCTLGQPAANVRRYAAAGGDAARATPAEVVSTQVAIRADNDQLVWNKERTRTKVVRWKSHKAYESYLLAKRRTGEKEE